MPGLLGEVTDLRSEASTRLAWHAFCVRKQGGAQRLLGLCQSDTEFGLKELLMAEFGTVWA